MVARRCNLVASTKLCKTNQPPGCENGSATFEAAVDVLSDTRAVEGESECHDFTGSLTLRTRAWWVSDKAVCRKVAVFSRGIIGLVDEGLPLVHVMTL